MADDVLLNKAAVIERTLRRIAEDYEGAEDLLETDVRRQDAIVLNLQRACQAAIDAGMFLVRKQRLGLPQASREAFVLLEEAGWLPAESSARLQAMVGFRNIALHDYQRLSLPILRSILDHRLDDLRNFARLLVNAAGERARSTPFVG